MLRSARSTAKSKVTVQILMTGKCNQIPVSGLRISYTRPSGSQAREYRVLGVDKSPCEIVFSDRDGQESNVASYFSTAYSVHLRFPRMPTLKVGSKARPIHLPIEVRSI